MPKKKSGLRVVDLFCGGGGFSEGFHQAGFDVVYGIDFWRPACDTHSVNGLGETVNMNLLDVDVDDILAVKTRIERRHGEVDVLIGSPPCTEFSYAKKGGKGDIEKGMLLVRKHLEFVALFKPRYWLIENVPRLEAVLDSECEGSRQKGWRIPYEKLGIHGDRFKDLGLEGDALRIPVGQVFTASDYGTCENRRRFIAGDFPIGGVDRQRVAADADISLGGLLERLESGIKKARKDGWVEDPNYPGHRVKRKMLRDHDYDTTLHPMYWEEMRHLKRRHIQYGRMSLPEDMSAPARTIMATSNSSSRESLILGTERRVLYQGRERPVFRQPTVREVACIQGFPLDFQLVASRLNDRYKLIGNAVPCQLSHALAKTILNDMSENSSSLGAEGSDRVKTTMARFERNHMKPLISRRSKVVGEAEDIGEVHSEFRARETKLLRRKLLSSKLENDSCVVIFENPEVEEGRVKGGPHWKACMQMGMGSKFHRVYFDEVSIPQVLRSLESFLDSSEIKDSVRHLMKDVDRGVPVLDDSWTEFPGYDAVPDEFHGLIGRDRLSLPGVKMLQKAFTSDMTDFGGVAGPIDLFDGLDALMFMTYRKKYASLSKRMVHVKLVKDNGGYTQAMDPRVVPSIADVDIPLVTMAAGIVAVHVLRRMYEIDCSDDGDAYLKSLEVSDSRIMKWAST
jgi:site-specific DNA-cytosine methylase